MSFWEDLTAPVESVGNGLIDYGKKIAKNPLVALATLGAYPAAQELGKQYKDYQWKNGGKQAQTQADQMRAANKLASEQQAAQDLTNQSNSLGGVYSSALGGSNMQSLTNKNTKRSILGSF